MLKFRWPEELKHENTMKKPLTMQQACAILDEYAETAGSTLKPWGPASQGVEEYLASGKLPNYMALPDDFSGWRREQQDEYLEYWKSVILATELGQMTPKFVQMNVFDEQIGKRKRRDRPRWWNKKQDRRELGLVLGSKLLNRILVTALIVGFLLLASRGGW